MPLELLQTTTFLLFELLEFLSLQLVGVAGVGGRAGALLAAGASAEDVEMHFGCLRIEVERESVCVLDLGGIRSDDISMTDKTDTIMV